MITTRNQTTKQKPHQRAVTLRRYSGLFLKCSREELQQNDPKTRKLMTIHKALHSRNYVNRLLMSRKRGRGRTTIQDIVDASIQRLEDYITKRGQLITANRNSTAKTNINRTEITRKQKWEEKQRYAHFKWNLKRENLVTVKQYETLKEKQNVLWQQHKNHAIRTNNVKAWIDKT